MDEKQVIIELIAYCQRNDLLCSIDTEALKDQLDDIMGYAGAGEEILNYID